MKKIAALLFLLFLAPGFILSQEIPKPTNPPRLVNDVAGVLSADQQQTLENRLVAYDDSTSNQVVIVTIKTTGDYDIQDYALKILREWGVGDNKNNNGLVILSAIDDKKLWIATGYGLEGALPDITVKTIIENDILPSFREGNYFRGFSNGIDAVIKAAAGEYKGKPKPKTGAKGKDLLKLVIIVAVILVLIGRSSGGKGGMMSRRGYGGWMAPTLFGMGGWSGGRGGGGGFGGGGFGGGFGGFGGGSGGGGGAGGSW